MRFGKTNGWSPDDKPPGGGSKLLSRNSGLRRLARRLILLFFVAIAILGGGFLWFADSVTSLRAPDGVKADAIVVLTGGYLRIEQALGLLRDGAGKRLLISGAHPTTTPNQICRATQASADLFDCCVDIGYDAIDTIGNANEIARWIHEHDYKSVLVVTNNYHMLRSLHELRRADPGTEFIPYPVINADLARRAWFTEPDTLRTMLSEYGKVVLASLRDWIGMERWSGLRTDEDSRKGG
ncbi:YdcF family protein [Aliirhizobium terrae]|uniref:YdcF family protein n=1 Tax=Terrirhizobium terrae TaxID=2926709 RepID=UPI002576497B|nr:YdcF family protein [Rhizobium sp. CC-CFT758]WJH41267.1 YdcF family protein [Rhizobium sp. CC-CFT758]